MPSNSGAPAGFEGTGVQDEEAAMMARFVETRDRRVFEVLFQRYKRPMVAHARRFVRSDAKAEELAQDVFVRVYTTKRYAPDAKFKTWLYRVATNLCLNELRRPEYGQRLEALDDDPRELPASSHTAPDVVLSGAELSACVARTLERLPPKQRAAFLMARQDDLSHEQIAEALETSVSAVKSLMHRALEALRHDVIEDDRRAR